ncbi:hypothetical protein [Streptomyces sp. NPDC059979]|uniref:hypothetical protein n=1 Tax=Streptomyces sp. NPDC059979 TaxID=3347021 RepID=UPI0036BEFE49
MEQRTVSPPQWAGFTWLAEEFRQASDTPIYDAVERQWLAQRQRSPPPPRRVVGRRARGGSW